MRLSEELFSDYTVIEESLIPYGFVKEDNSYIFTYPIHHAEFELRVMVKDQKLSAKLIEREFDEEYAAIDRRTPGSFVTELKEECKEILLDLRSHCFRQEYFHFAQTRRIAAMIREKYGIEPEQNKAGYGTNGVFRNPDTRKWIGLLMYNKKSNLTGDSDEKVEYLNLNFKKDADLYQQEGIYHPYKKRNAHWIAVILDDSLSDEQIMDLIDISYQKSAQ